MKKFALLSATTLLLAACAASEVQFPGVTPSPTLNISNNSGSFVGRKVNEFTAEYNNIHRIVNNNAQKLAKINQSIAEADSEYNAIINTINAKLESGTTPSNPDLTSALMKAQENLGTLESNTQQLASISANIIAEQEKLSALTSTVNATYAIPGAYDVDHADLNLINDALQQQSVTNADLISAVKSNISEQQIKAEQFRSEITQLNVAVAAGYINATPMFSQPDNDINVVTLKPIKVERIPAKNKSIRTSHKKVKIGKKFAVIEDMPKTKVAKTKDNTASKRPVAVKAKKQVAPKKVVAKPEAKIKGTIFSAEFPNDDVEYYNELERIVSGELAKNPGTKFEVIAIMPMDTAEQERIQNITARIFGDLLTMNVPAENLLVSAQSEIKKKIPSVVIVKK